MVHFNIDSILEGRIYQLSDVCRNMSVDCLVITKSKLDNSIPNNLLKINNFHDPLRRDINRHGGGCLVYIAECLAYSQVIKYQSNEYEHFWMILIVIIKYFLVNFCRLMSKFSG